MPKEPVAHGVLVSHPGSTDKAAAALAKEALSILRALDAPAREGGPLQEEDDYLVLVLGEGADPGTPEGVLAGRAATVVAVAEDGPTGRAGIARARKMLRARGATLGPRELLLKPGDFGYLGLESDGLRERLEILLRALVVDAERLRLRREGWEEPEGA